MEEVRLCLDKMKTRIDFDSHRAEEYQRSRHYQYDVMYNSRKTKLFPLKGVLLESHPKSSLTAVNQPLIGGGNLFVRRGYLHKLYRVWYEFNSDKADLAELAAHFDLLLHFGVISLIERAHLPYLEIAVDVDHVLLSDCVFLHPSLQVGTNRRWEGSEYVGSDLGTRHFFWYDKRNQLRREGMPDLGHDRLRIEARLQGAACPMLRYIDDLPNPFAELLVMDRKKFEGAQGPDFKILQEALAEGRSVQTAFGALEMPRRKAVIAVARRLQPDWWKPIEIWKQYPATLTWRLEMLRHLVRPSTAKHLLEYLRTHPVAEPLQPIGENYPPNHSPLWKFLQ